ncbi:MAG: pyridoxine 5'-phosphate synthase [Burkholderiaceae bacterium]|jgi:pyridoxine 5-phosphate synthase
MSYPFFSAADLVELYVDFRILEVLAETVPGLHLDPLEAALAAERAGADGICLSPGASDGAAGLEAALTLSQAVGLRVQLEMPADLALVDALLERGPRALCLVPLEFRPWGKCGGLDVRRDFIPIQKFRRELPEGQFDVVLQLEPDEEQIRACANLGGVALRLDTSELVCARDSADRLRELERVARCARLARGLGMAVSVGPTIDFPTAPLLAAIPEILALHAGPALAAKAFSIGWEKAIGAMKSLVYEERLRVLGLAA